MTNDWPLSFFYVKENSIIYLEAIQTENNISAFQKKISSKSRYFNQLGLTSTLGTIPECKIENKEECLKRKESKQVEKIGSNSFSAKDVIELIIQVKLSINLGYKK